jgi:pimeloyl-ACP methyl ester carboxylesterase
MKNQRRKQTIALAGAALLALALMPSMAAAQDYSAVQSNGNLQLRGYGTFFIPGNTHFVDANSQAPARQPGLSVINQMHVQFMLPQAQNGKKHNPIVFVHGGGLDSKCWQTTPDGRMGWDEYFVRHGFDTYLADQVSRARSGFDATKYNQVRNLAAPPTDQAAILIPTDQLAWAAFRWGTTTCTLSPCATTTTPHPGIRFPMNTVGVGAGSNLQFFDQDVPDMLGTLPNPSSPGCTGSACGPADPSVFWNTPAQMAELAKELGGAILVGHSESSTMPTRAALQSNSGCYPWTTAAACKVKGIIQLETGCFANLTPAQITTLSHIPILIEYGDFSPVPQPAAPCPTEIQQITNAGGDIKFAWIPALTPGSLYSGSPGAISGNEHMIMEDNNNQQIAQILIDWATSRGL